MISRVHPRVRGAVRARAAGARIARGSIPACAGQSSCRARGGNERRVHPRVRGAVAPVSGEPVVDGGPSPRARGSPRAPVAQEQPAGSIPACAGQSLSTWSKQFVKRVHPRVRGAVRRRGRVPDSAQGPSPRARGSLPRHARPLRRFGSIPACAGQSVLDLFALGAPWVHPRVRGAVAFNASKAVKPSGPSPRARGSRSRWLCEPHQSGSIPACAGQSPPSSSTDSNRRVHPRVRGAVHGNGRLQRQRSGPSPRARGSLSRAEPAAVPARSIPACAGQSGSFLEGVRGAGVHPRVRGAVHEETITERESKGPSPRARGSRAPCAELGIGRGSIPACAGQSAAPSS